MSPPRKCYLQCSRNTHEPINLPTNKPVVIGRSEITGIKNPSLSRSQVKLVADVDSSTVTLVQLGLNPSGVNGFSLKPNKEYILRHKDRLELLLDQYIYEIVFEPSPDEPLNNTPKGVKRMSDNDVSKETVKKQKFKNNFVYGWEEIDDRKLLIYTSVDVEAKSKIASFDLDGTLVIPKSGLRFPKDAEDWKFLFSEVATKLKELHESDYKLVIFTNQKGISSGKTKVSEFKKKIELVLSKLSVPMQVFIATGSGLYRKPAIGMWEALLEKNNGIEIDLNNSIYCGDAAGREKNWAPKKKKDHSVADRLFALNIGIPFKTPEEFFLGARSAPYTLPEFDPRNIGDVPLLEPEDSTLTLDEHELVVFVGGPASGKSHICKRELVPKGYVHVNRDQLGSWQKCVSAAENALKSKQNVVVDNTNPDKESRKRYVALAKKYGVVCRCFVMKTSIHQAKHNNLFREITDTKHLIINDIIIHSFRKNYVEPKLEEGFSEIIQINCIPNFANEEHKKLYHMYLLDK